MNLTRQFQPRRTTSTKTLLVFDPEKLAISLSALPDQEKYAPGYCQTFHRRYAAPYLPMFPENEKNCVTFIYLH